MTDIPTKLFHRDIYLPANVRNLSKKTIFPSITNHARREAESDRYGKIELPSEVVFSGADIVEAEMQPGRIIKLVLRLKYDETRDIVLAIGFDSGKSFIKTAWLNETSDTHLTLDRSRYATS